MINISKRQKLELLRSQMEFEQSSFISHWRDLADMVAPRRARFQIQDANKGNKVNRNIIDSTASVALRTLKSGMMSGITSPARPWFRLTTPDPELADFPTVKEWLFVVAQRMSASFNRSNIYNTLPNAYGDIGQFATGAILIEEDFDKVLHSYSLPIGSYRIANNEKLEVDTFLREFRMTVHQVVAKFGYDKDTGQINWDNISTYVKNLWDLGNREIWVDICHIIQPNENHDPEKIHSKFKKFESCYYERGTSSQTANYDFGSVDQNKYLSEKGYDYFPVLTPRWEVTGEDVYGTNCPGMEALGDVRQLQLGEKRVAQAIEKMINPPMVGPTSLRNQKTTILPGDITYSDDREGTKGFRPAHEVQVRIQEMEAKQQQLRERIDRAYFSDLFLMMSQSDRREITAREIDERREEKLLALGPVLQQVDQDLLDPLIDIAFGFHVKQNRIPAPPKELQGMELRVEYISIMAQAQKLIGLSSVERFSGFVGQMAQFKPDALDKVNTDKLVDVYGEMTGIQPGIVMSDDEANQIRQQRAQAQKAQQVAENIPGAASAARDLSQAQTGEGENALQKLIASANAGNLTQAV